MSKTASLKTNTSPHTFKPGKTTPVQHTA